MPVTWTGGTWRPEHWTDGESVPLPHSSFDDAVPHNLLFISITLASSAVTLFQVAIAAHAMRLTIASKSEWPIILGMAIVSVPIGIMLALAILFGKIAAGSTSITDVTASNALMIWAGSTVLSCFISTGLWLLLASIASVMFLHRLVWPLTSRLLYALERYQLVQNKLALNAAGATLAGIAITGRYGWQSILKLLGST